MRWAPLFHGIVFLFLIIVSFWLSLPADALRLEVSDIPLSEEAPLAADINSNKPFTGDQSRGFYPMPSQSSADPGGDSRLKLEYRATFPVAVTVETDGAVSSDSVGTDGALNISAHVILTKAWWSPSISASLLNLNAAEIADGRVVPGQTAVRSEWKIRF